MIPYPDIDPVAIQIGPLAVRWYGISYLVGIAWAWWLLDRRAGRPGSAWRREEVADLVFYAAVGGVLGGRLGYALFYNLPAYLESPLALLRVWEGGMSFHGGLLGALAAMALLARRLQRPFFAVTDQLAPAVPVALLCGRLGNFVNGELWGAPTDLPWAMVFPDPRAGGVARHPSQLYEAALEGAVLFAVLWWVSARPQPTRLVSGLFLVLYAAFRFLVEFVREPDAHLGYLAFGWLTMGQLLCVPMAILGAWLIASARRRARAGAVADLAGGTGGQR